MGYGPDYPDGFSRADAIAAGIEERTPGFERYFEYVMDETEGWDELSEDEQDRIREQAEDEYREGLEEARAERLAEERAEWDGYEPW